jgi:hypothetical protein
MMGHHHHVGSHQQYPAGSILGASQQQPAAAAGYKGYQSMFGMAASPWVPHQAAAYYDPASAMFHGPFSRSAMGEHSSSSFSCTSIYVLDWSKMVVLIAKST